MLSNPWIFVPALLVSVVMIGVGLKMVVGFLINREKSPDGLDPDHTE